ncbi:MAG: Hpt domain-containing protein [Sulfuriflexus sp.]|nr:Hpt domain-containing protein [Sulfuriflexus sp.]
MDSEIKVYDEQLSLQLAGGNEDLAQQMLEMLLNELPILQANMNEVFQEGDNAALYDNVHKINGSSRYCGVPAVGEAANNLELLLKNNDDDLKDAVNELNVEIERLLAL